MRLNSVVSFVLACVAVLLAGACSRVPYGDRVPLVYSQENTGAMYGLSEADMPVTGLETPVRELPDPLAWASGEGRVKDFSDWPRRRAEIFSQMQFYETGVKPAVDPSQLSARMSGDTLYVTVTVGGESLTLSSRIFYPDGSDGPFPVMIGASHMSLPYALVEGLPIAIMDFNERQVVNYGQWGPSDPRGRRDFDRLYPELERNGAYACWAWGMSRLIDGLQMLGPEVTKIDTEHIGVTGCSYAGKMALFCGAYDERIALTIAQEPGGGGAAAWRVSHTLEEVESLERTDYNWFLESLRDNFSGERVYNLPHDRHELCAMICPRALLVLGNTDYQWLADESAYVSLNAARKVWEHFGIADRMGWSINGGHPHCVLPEEQFPEVRAFIDRFLLGKEDTYTVVAKAVKFQDTTDLSGWIKF